MSSVTKTRYTPEQYLAMERTSEVKHEFYRGELFAMSGASREHNLIATNLTRVVGNQVVDRPCESYTNDMRVLVDATGLYTYPDVVVVCGEPEFVDAEVDTLLNPTAIVEILSPSTEGSDRGKKFEHYRQIPSLREYVVVAQDRVFVEHHFRHEGKWMLIDLRCRDETLRLASIGCEVPLREMYAKVAVEDTPNGRSA